MATDATLNATDLQNLLASGTVRVTTTGSGVQADNIRVKAPFSWSSASVLTLDAYRSIAIEDSVSITGPGGLTLATNDGNPRGALSFGSRGDVTFANLSASLEVNGVSYTLVNTIKLLADAIAANPSGAYALADDYDGSADGTYRSSPVGTGVAGIVEGLGHTISHVTIDASGFFAYVQASGSVRDIRLTNTSVHTSSVGTGAGGLVAENSGNLSGDAVFVHLLAGGSNSYVGALTGMNLGTITASSARGTIKSVGPGNGVGGLVGYNAGTISLSSATNSIEQSYGSASLGGLVSANETSGIITQSFATGAVRGGNVAGGLVSVIYAGEVEDSYSIGTPIGSSLIAGGFAGIDDSIVTKSYSTGTPNAGGYFGGFIGYNDTRENRLCYWDISTSNVANGVGHGSNRGVVGLTTTQLQNGLPVGFSSKIWAESSNVNGGLPYLVNNPPPK